MKYGVLFPNDAIRHDVSAIRDVAQTVEGLGYEHLQAYEWQLGVNKEVWPDFDSPWPIEAPLHEPLVLLAYMAAITTRLNFLTNLVVIPQRSTVLLAKQAAEVAVLSGGRLRLGIGVGNNPIPFEQLGFDYRTRGAMADEQIALLRELWAKQEIAFEGRWHNMRGVGIEPRPTSGHVPIWIGGESEGALRRAGRLGDGWLPLSPPGSRVRAAVETIRQHAVDAGRDPATVGLQGYVDVDAGWERAESMVTTWESLGAEYISVNTLTYGSDVKKSLGAWERFQREFISKR